MFSLGASNARTIIRPTQSRYNKEYDLQDKYEICQEEILRQSFNVTNCRSVTIDGSIYTKGYESEGDGTKRPIVVYCHGNAGNQIEVTSWSCLIEYTLHGMDVCGFDFSGCGNSEEKYITMGAHEVDDLNAVIDFLKEKGYTKIGLFGRSMGATVSFIVLSQRTDLIMAVLDSPFSSLRDFIWPIMKNKPPTEEQYQEMKDYILKNVGIDIDSVSAKAVACDVKLPFFMFHGSRDVLINPEQSKALFDSASSADKYYTLINVGHNNFRDKDIYQKATNFICQKFGINEFEIDYPDY